MIVIIGAVTGEAGPDTVVPAGLAVAIGRAAVNAGSTVELVARIGDDPAGDAVLLAIAAAGIGHVATLRDPARATVILPPTDDEAIDQEADASDGPPSDGQPGPTLDGADVGLALRYLTDYRVIVGIHPSAGVLGEVVAAASYAGAHLVVVTEASTDPGADSQLPDDALVLAADDGATGVGATIGRYAASVDGGAAPAAAFAETLGTTEATV